MALDAGASTAIGIDYSQTHVATARARHPDIAFVLGDVTRALADQLPGRFDAGLLVHVLEHIEEPVSFLSSLHESFDRLVIEVPDVDANWSNLSRRRLGLRLYTDDDHVREYSAPLLCRHLQAAGWRVSHVESLRGALIAVAEGSRG